MDLLGSILNSMDKPPAASEQQKALKRSIKIVVILHFCPCLKVSHVTIIVDPGFRVKNSLF